MLEKLYQGSKTVPFSAAPDVWTLPWRYMRPWDAVYCTSNRLTGLHRVFKDGTAVQSATVKTESNLHSLAGGGLGIVEKSGGPGNHSYNFYRLNDFTGLKHGEPYAVQTGKSFNLSHSCYADPARDWFLYTHDYTNLTCRQLSDLDTVLWTMTIPSLAWEIHEVDGRTVMLSAPDPRWAREIIVFVDYAAQTIKLTTKLAPYLRATYDSKCGVVLALMTDYTVSVWHPTPAPAELTAPALTPAAVKVFQGNKVSVSLLGDANEPCAGWWVRWRLEKGLGALAQAASRTDAQGAADNYYFGPTDKAAAGQTEKIIAEVVC